MFDTKATGAYLAGQALGNMVGRVAAANKYEERIDIQSMALAELRQRLGTEIGLKKAAIIAHGFELCLRQGLTRVVQQIGYESKLIAAHLAKYGSLTQTEFEELAPVTTERKIEDWKKRSTSIRISLEGALAYLDSEEGKSFIIDPVFALDAKESARILERVRAEVEANYKTE
jgi:hypothetical protein